MSEDDIFEIDGPLPENVLVIDMDAIDKSAINDAKALVENLSNIYCDPAFMSAHPMAKKRIDTELESLRVLIKMRKADEQAHDSIITAIASNSNNASLYRALTDIQKTILAITSKISETIIGINNILKGFQLEINFDKPKDEPEPESDSTRGSKDFINKMRKEMEGV